MRKQLGFVNFPDGMFETLAVLSVIGLVALLGGAGYGLYWLITHVRFV